MADLVGLADVDDTFVGETVLDPFWPELGVCVAFLLVSLGVSELDSGIWLAFPRPRNEQHTVIIGAHDKRINLRKEAWPRPCCSKRRE